jgi:hypothetical protein
VVAGWKDEKAQAITGSIFYCRGSADFSVSKSNKFTFNLTGQYFQIGDKNILAKRYTQLNYLAVKNK